MNTSIGCIILQQPFFLPEDYHANLMQGKRFDASVVGSGRDMVMWAATKLEEAAALRSGVMEPGAPMYGEPTMVRTRLGQGTFRGCAFRMRTSEKVRHHR